MGFRKRLLTVHQALTPAAPDRKTATLDHGRPTQDAGDLISKFP